MGFFLQHGFDVSGWEKGEMLDDGLNMGHGWIVYGNFFNVRKEKNGPLHGNLLAARSGSENRMHTLL